MKPRFLPISLLLCFSHLATAQKDASAQIVFPKGHKKNILKFTPLSFFWDFTSIAFERSLRHNRSLEFKLNIVGTGRTRFDVKSAKGALITVGYKFINQPSSPILRNRYRHPLRGWYFRPDFTVACYKENYTLRVYEPNMIAPILKPASYLMTNVCLVPTVGVQKVNRLGLATDFFVGGGLALVSPINGDRIVRTGRYGNLIALKRSKNYKIGLSYALKMGLLFGLNF